MDNISKLELHKKNILIREKKLLESNYNFLKCKIINNILIVKGFCCPTDQSPTYEYTLTYDLKRPPKVIVDNPKIEYNEEIHMYPSDNSLCLYHPDIDNFHWDIKKHHIYNTIIPWTQEWFIYYELYLISGKWQHPQVDHRIERKLLDLFLLTIFLQQPLLLFRTSPLIT